MRKRINISSSMIQLNQLLKWSGILETGGQTAFLLEEENILLNGVPVREKRKKIYPGDIVTINDNEYIIVQDDSVNDES
jgi:ribosome-associated protein